jgi:L,D-transpeptidase YnhG
LLAAKNNCLLSFLTIACLSIFSLLLASCSTLPPPSRDSAHNIYNKLQQSRNANSQSPEYLNLVKIIEDADVKYLAEDNVEAEKLYSLALLKGEALRENLYVEEQEITTILATPTDTSTKTDSFRDRAKKAPSTSASDATKAGKMQRKYSIEVSISKRILTINEIDGTDLITFVREYSVGTVARGVETFPIGKGRVTKIDFNPIWYPTEYTREIYRKKGIELPKAIPAGSSLNYMGAFKIHLSHKTSHGAVYRIHGNNNQNRVGKRVTGGCICMDNKEGLELAKLISVGTEVNIVH